VGPVTRFGRWLFAQVEDLGRLFVVLFATLYWFVRPPYRIRETFRQMQYVGVGSFLIISLTGTFTGMVLALQTYSAFVTFNAESLVGATVALSMTRELGPVLSGLMVTARAGSAMAANLGTMRVTEQIDALYAMATEPVHYLVVPRVNASVLMLPVLTIMGDAIGIIGGWLVSVGLFGANSYLYMDRTFQFLEVNDITSGLIKAAFFGLILSATGCAKGFYTSGGAEGVGRGTTSAVVTACLYILLSDFFLTKILF